MLDLKESCPSKMLHQFALYLNADIEEEMGASQLFLNNKTGRGTIKLYEVFPGLTAWVYDIELTDEFRVKPKFSSDNTYYFAFHVTGYQMTKHANESEYIKIHQGQNFLIKGENGLRSEFVIPANIKFQSCYLIYQPDLLMKPRTKLQKQLKTNIDKTFEHLKGIGSNRYFGQIDNRTGLFAEIIVKNNRTDLVGRLLTEAGILNMLASQLAAYDYDLKSDLKRPNISKTELEKIMLLGDYIRENLSERFTIAHLGRHFGLSPKKLQAGIKFLFGCTVNEFINKIRLGAAHELIQKTDLSLAQISYEIGYSSTSYFSKMFKQEFGILPKDYKKSFKNSDLLFEITYRSMAISELKNSDVEDIVSISRLNNRKLGITGSLIFHRKVFFQLIEGPKDKVLELYEKIKKDERHFDIDTMWEGPKPSRDFGNWNLALLTDSGILEIPYEGETRELNLGDLMGDIDEPTLVSQHLWRKVRNAIKASTV